MNLSTDHFTYRTDITNGNGGGIKYSLEEYLVKDGPYIGSSRLKKRLLKAGLLEYKCSVCGNTGKW